MSWPTPPTAARPAAGGDGARLTAASRFFAHDARAPHDVRSSPLESTASGLDKVPWGWAVHEPPAGAWTGPPATTGLGPLGQTACQGLHVHSTRPFPPARVPLGLLAQHGWARDRDDVGKRTRRQQWPISQHASPPGRTRLEAVCRARAWCAPRRVGRVGARAAAVFDLLAAARPAGVALLGRASWDRWVEVPERAVWAPGEAPAVVEHRRWPGPRRGPPPGRDAPVARRCCPGTLCPPRPRQAAGLSSVTLWAVQGRAIDPPMDVKPMEWRRLTPVEGRTAADALERVTWSAGRWGLAVWPRMVHRGGRLAARPVAPGERVQRCVRLSSVMAGRVL